MPRKYLFIRYRLILTLLFFAGSVSVSAHQVMPKEVASRFCQLLIDDGNSIAPLSFHVHRLMTQQTDSLTPEQLFVAYVFHHDNWRQMRLFPHSDGKGNIIWYAPSDDIPERVGTEHLKYIHEVMPRLSAVIQAGDWKTADEYIGKMIDYQCQFGAEETTIVNNDDNVCRFSRNCITLPVDLVKLSGMHDFLLSLLNVMCEMAPYLLLGFLIAGILHVFVPQNFYRRYLSKKNKWSVLWAAMLGIPLPLCSCGVIPTAISLRNEKASKGAVASFLIATPQTGIDSILATFSLMGLGFAIVRPVAALVTGVCGGLLVNRLIRDDEMTGDATTVCQVERGSKLWRVLKYGYYDLIRDIGLRLVVGLVVAALIQVVVPDEFFLSFGSQPLLQMLVILMIAVPMYICSTGSIPVAAALMMKGLSPGAALVMLMAGPAVNMASILVVQKSMGRRFTSIYLLTIVGFSVFFGLLLNATGLELFSAASQDVCCAGTAAQPSPLKMICATVLTLLIIFALMMKLFSKFSKKPLDPDTVVYRVEDMHCSHCEAAVIRAVENLPGVESAKASASANTLTIKGPISEEAVRSAVESIGYTFKGKM